MSRENVDLVRNLYAEWDFQLPPDAMAERWDRVFREYLDEQFELRLPPDYPEGEPIFRGREGLAQATAMLREVWRDWRFEPERFLDAGKRVVVFIRIMGKGAASEVPFDLESTHVWTIHAGRAASLHAYRDRSEALEAAGVSE
jgi:ketosteroid isomerase-like protein